MSVNWPSYLFGLQDRVPDTLSCAGEAVVGRQQTRGPVHFLHPCRTQEASSYCRLEYWAHTAHPSHTKVTQGCGYTCTHAPLVHTCAFIECMCTCVCTYVCVCMTLCVCMCVCVCVCVVCVWCVCVHSLQCACMCVCVWLYMYVHKCSEEIASVLDPYRSGTEVNTL